MKRALIYASVASMIRQFNMENISLLQSMGYAVEVGCNFEFGNSISREKLAELKEELHQIHVEYHHIPIPRSPADVKHIRLAYQETKRLLEEKQYDLIHCHSPVGGVLVRLAEQRGCGHRNCRMVYTAHGFHFYQGAPLKNWLLYYPVEKLCSRWTDALITINQEDYSRAKRKLKAVQTLYVPGVGIDVEWFAKLSIDRNKKRRELGIPQEAFLLFSVGELNKNKNHEAVIRAVAALKDPKIHYAVAGLGELREHRQEQLLTLAKNLGVAQQFHLLGYRPDVKELYQAADVYVHPSFREGLPVSIMEAMANGLPCLVSDIRGNKDLIQDGVGGKLIALDGFAENLAEQIEQLKQQPETCSAYGMANRERVKLFSRACVEEQMRKIYLG